MKLKNSILIYILISFLSCKKELSKKEVKKSKEPKVVSVSNKFEYNKLKRLNLDSSYVNLLNPNNVSEFEYKAVLKSWSNFHKKIVAFISKEKFKWEVADSTITILNKIYFDKDGTINYYTFKIKNTSISSEKRKEYEKILQKFSKHIKLNLKREEKYAQCGKIKYKNY